MLLGWEPLAAAFLGGVTYVSSSGIASKLIHEAIAEIAVGAGLERRLGPLTASYVLALAILGPLAARVAEIFTRSSESSPRGCPAMMRK